MLEQIFQVFTSIGDWLTDALDTLMGLFWNGTENQLTLLGILGVVGLGFSVIFLLIGIIQRFLKFQG